MRYPWLALGTVGYFILSCKTPTPEAETKGIGTTVEDKLNTRLARNRDRPWVAWQWGKGTRDDTAPLAASKAVDLAQSLLFIDNARLELIENNLVDTNGAYGDPGKRLPDGHVSWPAMQDGKGCGQASMSNPQFRARSLDGRCNDFQNPLMGSVGQHFGRNVSPASANGAFDAFAKAGLDDPNPRDIASALMRRKDPFDYKPAPFFNMWSAAWIQFQTHDWFAHAPDGVNDKAHTIAVDESKIAPAEQVGQQGKWTVAQTPASTQAIGKGPSKAFSNKVTHWWDASQVYGWDDESRARVRQGPYLKLGADGLLPLIQHKVFGPQEAAAFGDNWWVGLSLVHTAFSREHNWIVDQLRASANPPSGAPKWSDDELFDTARLSIAALIAKIHTIEWTPQLLYNHVADFAQHANWNGIIGEDKIPQQGRREVHRLVRAALKKALNEIVSAHQKMDKEKIVALTAAGPGIAGMKTAEHFGTPFTLPEEFTAVYRLHPILPDYIPIFDVAGLAQNEVRPLHSSDIKRKLPNAKVERDMLALTETLRAKSRSAIDAIGIDNWAYTFGMVPCGQLTLGNYPQFLTNLPVPSAVGGTVDLAALDLIRDRERGVPRFNEFRRQIHLTPLKDFDDFIDRELAWEVANKQRRDLTKSPALTAAELAEKTLELASQRDWIAKVRKVYDNDIEKVDLQVGILAEFSRPHDFVISETQFQIFILNASRRLFSDRFLTEAFRPQFYTQWGYDYVNRTSFRDVLARGFPKLAPMLNGVENAFDVWDRQREGFSLASKPRAGFKRVP